MDEAINRQTQIGLYLVEDAILELLYITRLNDGSMWLNDADIHHALGLPSDPNWYCEFAQLMLNALHEAGKIEREGQNVNLFGESPMQNSVSVKCQLHSIKLVLSMIVGEVEFAKADLNLKY